MFKVLVGVARVCDVGGEQHKKVPLNLLLAMTPHHERSKDRYDTLLQRLCLRNQELSSTLAKVISTRAYCGHITII